MTEATPAQIKAAREAAGDTQAQAVARLYRGRRMTWDDWESGRRTMDPALLELYLLKTGQHPELVLTPRR